MYRQCRLEASHELNFIEGFFSLLRKLKRPHIFSRSSFVLYLTIFIFLLSVIMENPSEAEILTFKDQFEFLINGLPLNSQTPPISIRVQNRYERAVSYIGSNSCILKDDQGVDDPSKGMDWAITRDVVELEVCLFKAASLVSDNTIFSNLLLASGFSSVSVNLYNPDVTRRKGIAGDGYLISSAISTASLPEGFGGFLGTWPAYGLSVGLFADATGKPYDVKVVLNSN